MIYMCRCLLKYNILVMGTIGPALQWLVFIQDGSSMGGGTPFVQQGEVLYRYKTLVQRNTCVIFWRQNWSELFSSIHFYSLLDYLSAAGSPYTSWLAFQQCSSCRAAELNPAGIKGRDIGWLLTELPTADSVKLLTACCVKLKEVNTYANLCLCVNL